MRTLGMIAKAKLNESRKDWKLPSESTVYTATATNVKLGVGTAVMDATLKGLWDKYCHIQPNQYWILAPSFKRSAYEKGDQILRADSQKIETKGEYEVYNFKNKYAQFYAFFNNKTKIWYMNCAGYLSYND